MQITIDTVNQYLDTCIAVSEYAERFYRHAERYITVECYMLDVGVNFFVVKLYTVDDYIGNTLLEHSPEKMTHVEACRCDSVEELTALLNSYDAKFFTAASA